VTASTCNAFVTIAIVLIVAAGIGVMLAEQSITAALRSSQ
jgi:hypothetical protein